MSVSNKVSFSSPDNIPEKTSSKKDAFVRKKSEIFTRKSSQVNLAEKTPISDTAKKTNQTYAEAPHDASTTSSISTHSANVSNTSEDSTTESVDQVGQEVINEHVASPTVHLETFKTLFGIVGEDGKISNLNEVKIIYLRMCEFANASGATPDIMVQQLKRGMEVANEIASPDFKNNTKEYSANDLAAFDWFIRAQHAKMGQLYLKGATKIPDPDHRIAQFILQVRGMNHGNETREVGPYPRGSSHQPEDRDAIKNSAIALPNNHGIAFSQEGKQKLLKARVKEENIHVYADVALGIDVSGKNLTPPGKKSGTYLFMLVNDVKHGTPVIFMKAESNSAAPIEGKYGNKSELSKEKFEHGIHLYKKFMPANEGGAFPDLKEDKLSSHILVLLKGVKLLEGGPNTPLRESYDNLQKTTQFKNDYALPQLKAHLENQLKPDVKLEKGQKEKILALLEAVNEALDNSQKLNKSTHPIVPRSREVILPSLHEMLQNKTTFAP